MQSKVIFIIRCYNGSIFLKNQCKSQTEKIIKKEKSHISFLVIRFIYNILNCINATLKIFVVMLSALETIRSNTIDKVLETELKK